MNATDGVLSNALEHINKLALQLRDLDEKDGLNAFRGANIRAIAHLSFKGLLANEALGDDLMAMDVSDIVRIADQDTIKLIGSLFLDRNNDDPKKKIEYYRLFSRFIEQLNQVIEIKTLARNFDASFEKLQQDTAATSPAVIPPLLT